MVIFIIMNSLEELAAAVYGQPKADQPDAEVAQEREECADT